MKGNAVNKIIVILVALALILIGGGPAEAAKKKHKTCKNQNYKIHHPKKCGAKKQSKARKVAVRAAAPARVATRAEYNRLEAGMTRAQVQSLFDAPSRVTQHYPLAVLVACPPDSEFFCTDEDLNGTGSVVVIGARDNVEWYTGRDKYDGRTCYSIYMEFYEDALGVSRLQRWENWSNICTSKYS